MKRNTLHYNNRLNSSDKRIWRQAEKDRVYYPGRTLREIYQLLKAER